MTAVVAPAESPASQAADGPVYHCTWASDAEIGAWLAGDPDARVITLCGIRAGEGDSVLLDPSPPGVRRCPACARAARLPWDKS